MTMMTMIVMTVVMVVMVMDEEDSDVGVDIEKSLIYFTGIFGKPHLTDDFRDFF